MQVINLTPHDITIITPEGTRVLPASGQVARVASEAELVGSVELDGLSVPVSTQKFGAIVGLPEPQDGTIYVVSLAVAQAAAREGRTDVVSPDTSRAIRGADGQIQGVPGFVRPS